MLPRKLERGHDICAAVCAELEFSVISSDICLNSGGLGMQYKNGIVNLSVMEQLLPV